MLRTLFATTALTALLVAGASAQDAAPAAANTSLLATGYTVTNEDNLASHIVGRQVYSSTAADAEHIGDVDDLVVGNDGEVAAVIISVGGFLGLGEKHVAVKYSELEWAVAEDDTERFVLPTTREALEAAPGFEALDDDEEAALSTVDGTAQPVVTGPIDRDTLTDAPLTAEELIGTNAYGPADEHLGAIGDVVLGADGTTVEALVIDFGGFLGIGTKPVAVAVENVRFAVDEDGDNFLFVNVTRDQLDAAVAYDADTFEAERDAQILRTTAL